MLRLGLCCLFQEEPIKFRHSTAKNILKFEAAERDKKISELCLHNSKSLLQALETCHRLDIKSFRVMSPLFPLYTHPDVGYNLAELYDRDEITDTLKKVKKFKQAHDIRLSFHPDQFNVLNSPRPEVVQRSIIELSYQAMLAEAIDADVINIHLGGVYDDKKSAIQRFIETFASLPGNIQQRLTVENDDKSYTPQDLKQVFDETGIPFVYDVHHHRCNPDGLSIEEATDMSIKIWQNLNREPYFHISSPKLGWNSGKPQAHADYIDFKDFPDYWKKLKSSFTLDVEAKAKELAVIKLREQLNGMS